MWSKLVNTPVAKAVFAHLDANVKLRYHNTAHVLRLYEVAELLKVPYCPNLDMAILWHDYITDSKGQNAERSTLAMLNTYTHHPEWFDGIDLWATRKHIETTIDHSVDGETNSMLPILDLYDLTIQERTDTNFWLINEENQLVYEKTAAECAQGTIDFMIKLEQRMMQNATNDPDNAEFWNEVKNGCERTIELSHTLVELSREHD